MSLLQQSLHQPMIVFEAGDIQNMWGKQKCIMFTLILVPWVMKVCRPTDLKKKKKKKIQGHQHELKEDWRRTHFHTKWKQIGLVPDWIKKNLLLMLHNKCIVTAPSPHFAAMPTGMKGQWHWHCMLPDTLQGEMWRAKRCRKAWLGRETN